MRDAGQPTAEFAEAQHTNTLCQMVENDALPFATNQVECGLYRDTHYPVLVDVLAPQGKIGVIDDPVSLDAKPLKRKAASLHWEFMFARSLFGTPDMIAQHQLLNEVADRIDAGIIRTTAADF